jgi:polo-like kinase 4
VAVKVIDLAMIEVNGLRKFLDREVKINAMVEHSYVLKCYEISYTASNCFLVTEICPEGDLQRYIKQRGKLSEEEALRLLKQLVVGLRYLHSRQILHRDLKSSNVFLKNG